MGGVLHFVSMNTLYRERFLVEEGTYDFWNIFVLTQGSCLVNGEVATAGDVVVFAPQKPFSRRVMTPMTFLSIHVEVQGEPPALPNRLVFEDKLRVLSTAAFLQKSADELQDRALCSHFLQALCLQYEAEQRLCAQSTARFSPTLRRALALIEQEEGIGNLARRLGVSHAHLIHLFRRELGRTPVAYLVKKRIERAKRMLLDADNSIQQIAQACGFANAYYFSNAFKRETGYAPTAYRAMYRA